VVETPKGLMELLEKTPPKFLRIIQSESHQGKTPKKGVTTTVNSAWIPLPFGASKRNLMEIGVIGKCQEGLNTLPWCTKLIIGVGITKGPTNKIISPNGTPLSQFGGPTKLP